MEVLFFETGTVENVIYKYAIIGAKFQNQWIFVRHENRNTWEIPGGTREPNEEINNTAKRELYEETGATIYDIFPVCDYGVKHENKTTYGRIYFADIKELSPLPKLEIVEIKLSKELPLNITYPDIQPFVFKKIKDYLSLFRVYMIIISMLIFKLI